MNELWSFATSTGIFDNGTGTGSIISHILETYGTDIPKTSRILAGDFSEPMLDVVRQKKAENLVQQGDIWERLEIHKIDAHDLSSIENNSFSHVAGGHLYFLLPNPRQALTEVNRVLCPSGVIALTNGKSSQHIDALCNAVEAVRPSTNLKLLKEPWSSEEGVRAELEATGFVHVETHLHDTSISYTSHEDLADMLLVMPVMKDASKDFSNREKEQLRQELVKNMKEMSPIAPGSLKGVGIIALARKRG